MTTSHLSEDEIQLAAEAASPLPAPQAVHVRNCPVCQARIATYQQLFTAVANLPKPVFEFDLVATVLAQLPAPAAKPSFPWLLCAVAVVVLSLGAGFLGLFWQDIIQLFRGLSTVVGAGLLAVVGCIVAGQCLELLATHRRQMQALTLS